MKANLLKFLSPWALSVGLLTGLLGPLLSCPVLADGYSVPSDLPNFNQEGFYISANGGYAMTDWQKSIGTVSGDDWTYGNDTPLVGGETGYQIMKYGGIEVGGFYFFPMKVTRTGLNTLQNSTWLAYAAVKLMTPIYEQLSIFAKLGADYEQQNLSPSSVAGSGSFNLAANPHTIQPMAALGIQVNYRYVFALVEAMHFGGRTENAVSGQRTIMPDINMADVGIGLRFYT